MTNTPQDRVTDEMLDAAMAAINGGSFWLRRDVLKKALEKALAVAPAAEMGHLKGWVAYYRKNNDDVVFGSVAETVDEAITVFEMLYEFMPDELLDLSKIPADAIVGARS